MPSAEVEPLHVDQPVTQHVHRRLRLFQYDIPDQWLVNTIERLHGDKQHFAVNRTKPFDLNFNRATD